jgi:hypothetical protein
MTTINASISDDPVVQTDAEPPWYMDRRYWIIRFLFLNGNGSIDKVSTTLLSAMLICLIMTGALFTSWTSEERTITVASKEIISSDMNVVGTDHVLYKTLSVLDYSDMEKGGTYHIKTAHNWLVDDLNFALGWKPDPVHIDAIITK